VGDGLAHLGVVPGEAVLLAFKAGAVTVEIRADGSFTWKRKVRPDKSVALYMAWRSTDSNTVRWRTVR
jgi:hypothetical protein